MECYFLAANRLADQQISSYNLVKSLFLISNPADPGQFGKNPNITDMILKQNL